MIEPYRVEIALRWMKTAGADYQLARGILQDARKHRSDIQLVRKIGPDIEFIREMVRIARHTNRRAVASARAAREWVQP